MKVTVAFVALAALLACASAATTPTPAQLQTQINQLKAQIKALTGPVNQIKPLIPKLKQVPAALTAIAPLTRTGTGKLATLPVKISNLTNILMTLKEQVNSQKSGLLDLSANLGDILDQKDGLLNLAQNSGGLLSLVPQVTNLLNLGQNSGGLLSLVSPVTGLLGLVGKTNGLLGLLNTLG